MARAQSSQRLPPEQPTFDAIPFTNSTQVPSRRRAMPESDSKRPGACVLSMTTVASPQPSAAKLAAGVRRTQMEERSDMEWVASVRRISMIFALAIPKIYWLPLTLKACEVLAIESPPLGSQVAAVERLSTRTA